MACAELHHNNGRNSAARGEHLDRVAHCDCGGRFRSASHGSFLRAPLRRSNPAGRCIRACASAHRRVRRAGLRATASACNAFRSSGAAATSGPSCATAARCDTAARRAAGPATPPDGTSSHDSAPDDPASDDPASDGETPAAGHARDAANAAPGRQTGTTPRSCGRAAATANPAARATAHATHRAARGAKS